MNNKEFVFKIIFSGTFILLAILILFFDWFKDRIDAKVITLILIAFIPWIVKYIKSIKAFGVKADLVSEEKKKEITNEITKIEVNDKSVVEKNFEPDYSQPIGSEKNPIVIESINSIYEVEGNLEKLVMIRYQIEKMLRELCFQNNIEPQKSIRETLKILLDRKIIKNTEVNIINDILPILNKAVHSQIKDVDNMDLDWIIENGISLLLHLEILTKDPKAYWMIQK